MGIGLETTGDDGKQSIAGFILPHHQLPFADGNQISPLGEALEQVFAERGQKGYVLQDLGFNFAHGTTMTYRGSLLQSLNRSNQELVTGAN